MLNFLNDSVTAFHAVKNVAKMLSDSSYTKLHENEKWNLTEGEKYFVTRNSSSIIAFTYNKKDFDSFSIVASHSDFPCFKLKENFEIKLENNYIKLNTEPYGGMIMSSWMDRPLSLAGRVMILKDGKIIPKIINIDKDLFVIPNLAIHMSREINSGYKFNPQTDMLPLSPIADLPKLIKGEVGEGEILSSDLFLYVRDKSKILGDEFLLSPRLDDLACVFTSTKALINSKKSDTINMIAIFDNEEVGSSTKQGAESDFLYTVLKRICFCSDKNEEDYSIALSKSFMVSADNAHAVHPNHSEKSDSSNRNYLNKGIVIKFNANQKYTSDAVSSAIFKNICKRAEIPYQVFHNRSDMPGGSTLGNISNTKVSLNSIDIGIPQLSMHSAVETAGVKDTEYMQKVLTEFFNSKTEMEF